MLLNRQFGRAAFQLFDTSGDYRVSKGCSDAEAADPRDRGAHAVTAWCARRLSSCYDHAARFQRLFINVGIARLVVFPLRRIFLVRWVCSVLLCFFDLPFRDFVAFDIRHIIPSIVKAFFFVASSPRRPLATKNFHARNFSRQFMTAECLAGWVFAGWLIYNAAAAIYLVRRASRRRRNPGRHL
jgi:hypothetical protein